MNMNGNSQAYYQKMYAEVYEKYQKLKKRYPYACRMDIVRLITPELKERILFDGVLSRHFGVKGDKFTIQAALTKQVMKRFDELKNEKASYREIAAQIHKEINDKFVNFDRILNIISKNTNGVKKPVKSSVLRNEKHILPPSITQIYKNDILRFSPAWCGKIQAA